MGSARVLHRRYLRGEIGEQEWMWYRTQPFHSAGPINFRPFLDREWFESGGAEVVMMGIGFYSIPMPSIPTLPDEWLTQHQSELEDGTPPFSALLSRDRFARRVQGVKKEFKRMLAHPLLFEIATTHSPERPVESKAAAEKWKKLQAGERLEEAEKPILGFLADDYLVHFGGASLGNVSPTLRHYVLPFLIALTD